jgi:hypothetical protein
MSNKKEKLDSYHYHEAIDRLYLIIDIGHTHLLEHPVFTKHKEAKKKVKKAMKLLAETYQLVGNLEPMKHRHVKPSDKQ